MSIEIEAMNHPLGLYYSLHHVAIRMLEAPFGYDQFALEAAAHCMRNTLATMQVMKKQHLG